MISEKVLQLPGDGNYYVALFPRLRTEPVPTFATLGDGKIIKVQGEFGTDYGFLSAQRAEADAEGIHFSGTAACVQERGGEVALVLGAEGQIRYKDVTVTSEGPVSVRWRALDRVKLELPQDHAGTEVTLKLPGRYRCDRSGLDAKVSGNELTLRVPRQLSEVNLSAE